MRRAIRENDKEARRQALRDVAWRLFQSRPYEAINVQEVAEQAGLAKGTVYLYFASKEELFLSIQAQQFERWFDSLDDRLRALGAACAPGAVVAAITASLVAVPALVRLFAISHAVLERNAGPAPLRQFKRLLRARLLSSGSLLETALPALPPGDGARLLLHAYALMVGLHGLADPPPAVAALLDSEPELAMFSIDFASEFALALTALLHGWPALRDPLTR